MKKVYVITIMRPPVYPPNDASLVKVSVPIVAGYQSRVAAEYARNRMINDYLDALAKRDMPAFRFGDDIYVKIMGSDNFDCRYDIHEVTLEKES